ncbi:hypothetical protein VKT23_019292 [Stygiomarasmius scandens]|uniref:Uncharacterized protein n=1 Tax=Marasmiellus scandens TaxID=2682957 RepID=A0ABR1IRB5_9AGAR
MQISYVFSLVALLVIGLVFPVSASVIESSYPEVSLAIHHKKSPQDPDPAAHENSDTDSTSATVSTRPSNLPPVLSPCDGDACNNTVKAMNECREQGNVDPLCACNDTVISDLVKCESCVMNNNINSDAASTAQQQLNLYIGLCNEAIASAMSTNPGLSTFSSRSVSFSENVNTATLRITTAPLHQPTGTETPPTDSGSNDGNPDASTTPGTQPNSATLSGQRNWFIFIIQFLAFASVY